MIKAIIFDWAGVIGADGYWVWLRKNIRDLESRRDYFQDISEKVDSAEMLHADFEKKLADISGKSAIEVWQEVKREIVINRELVGIIEKLKSRYKIGLLSNFTYPWLNEILSENNLYKLFDAYIISSEHNVIKPNPDAFKKILNLLNVNAGESVFVDDRQVHVDAANKIGLNGLLYKDNIQLVHDLGQLGIEV